MTGLDCPFCGGTRAIFALAHGHIAQAIGFNVLVVLGVPLLWFGWRRSPRVVLGVLLVFAVLRNLPVPGLSWMASYR